MDKEFIPYEQSLELKELGFNEPCFGFYVNGELRGVNLGLEEMGGVEPYYQRFGFHTLRNSDITNTTKIIVTTPTFSQSFRWFREKYGYNGVIEGSKRFGFEWCIYRNEFEYIKPRNNTPNYEESELQCLSKLIDIVKQTINS